MSLAPTLEYLHWSHIAGAVLEVFLVNQREEGSSHLKASADTWAIHSQFRQEVWVRSRNWWCIKTGEDIASFPYSEDFVAKMYFRFRKRNADEIAAFRREIEEARKGA